MKNNLILLENCKMYRAANFLNMKVSLSQSKFFIANWKKKAFAENENINFILKLNIVNWTKSNEIKIVKF